MATMLNNDDDLAVRATIEGNPSEVVVRGALVEPEETLALDAPRTNGAAEQHTTSPKRPMSGTTNDTWSPSLCPSPLPPIIFSS